MTDTLALEQVFDAVVSRFAGEGTNADNYFGWRAPAQQKLRDRLVWIPGDPGGRAGKDAPPRNPGRNPRPIGTFQELCTIEISASDATDPENERLQWKATRLLRDAWHRAVYLAAHGTFQILDESWILTQKERRFGTALRVLLSIESMIPDAPLLSAPVNTVAVIEVDDLNVAETDTIEAA
jgi:hypothetical protein